MATGDSIVGICHNQTFRSQVGCLNSLQFGTAMNHLFERIYEWAFVGASVFIFIDLFFVRGKTLMSERLMSGPYGGTCLNSIRFH